MSAAAPLARRQILAYGVLGLPLAFAALPLYVHVPKLYAEHLGLSLALIGAILLGARIVDALTDPLFGWLGDHVGGRTGWILLALPVLGLGMLGLLSPPASAGALWLLGLLVVACAGYSLASVNYHAWGAEMARAPGERTRVMASREGFGLAGVVLAAALPALLADGEAAGLARLAWGFLPLLGVAALVTLMGAPAAPRLRLPAVRPGRALRAALARPAFVRLLLLFALGGVAASIPASTVLFYVDDVLARPGASGPLLAVYFVAAAAGLPLWVRLADRLGKVHAWMVAMGLSIVAFGWAATLGAGDVLAFGIICVASGLALGADLALPPAILADQLGNDSEAAGAGASFGWWNLVAKASLALAAGIALPLLEWLGYTPGARGGQALAALAGVYALLPVLLKTLALALTWRWRHRLGAER
jgi:Na+/melibiose symporter-like transporter